MRCPHQKPSALYKFSGASLLNCGDCGLVFAKNGNNFDPAEHYKDFYQNEIAARFPSPVEYLIRVFRFFRAFKTFTLYPKAKSILDIGSGRGFMLYYLKKYFGYTRAEGTQISNNAVEFSRNKLGLTIYDKDFLEIASKNMHFDIVSLWHVLEHVADPESYIEKAWKTLNNNGKLIIEVPNFNSWTRKLAGPYWLGLDLKNHFYFFTPQSLTLLLEKYRFKINTIHTYSLEYSTFISVQSIISRITKTDQQIYESLQGKPTDIRIIYHILLFCIITPICFIINLLLFFSKKGEVLLIIAEKS